MLTGLCIYVLRTVLPNNSIFHFSLPERFPISSLHLSVHSSSLTAVFLPVPLSSRFRLLILVPTFKKKGSSINSLKQKWEIFILKLDDRVAVDVCASNNDLIFFFCHQHASDCLRSQAEIEQTRSNIRREENYFKDFSLDQVFFPLRKMCSFISSASGWSRLISGRSGVVVVGCCIFPSCSTKEPTWRLSHQTQDRLFSDGLSWGFFKTSFLCSYWTHSRVVTDMLPSCRLTAEFCILLDSYLFIHVCVWNVVFLILHTVIYYVGLSCTHTIYRTSVFPVTLTEKLDYYRLAAKSARLCYMLGTITSEGSPFRK